MSRSTPIEQIPNEQHKTQITNEAEVTVQQIQQTPSLPPQQVQSLQSNYDDIHELQRELALIKKQNELMHIQNTHTSQFPEHNLDNNINKPVMNLYKNNGYSFINFRLTDTDIKEISLLTCCYYISSLQACKLFFQRILEFIPNENIITAVHCIFFSVVYITINKVFI